MTGIGFARDTVTVLRAPLATDPYGNQVPDWASAARTVVAGCRVQPQPGAEQTVDRDAVTTRWRLFAPAGADITATDRVEHAGVVYEIDGPVQRWPSPTGRLAHLECNLRGVDG